MTITTLVSILYKYHISLARHTSSPVPNCGTCRSFISIIFPKKMNYDGEAIMNQCRSFISIIFPMESSNIPRCCRLWCRSFISIIFPPKGVWPMELGKMCRSFISIIFPRSNYASWRLCTSVSILYKYHISRFLKMLMLIQICLVSILYKYHISP